jgi:hypothetical protein
LRDDILRGDYRVLYLAWLKTLEMEDVLGSVTEPPVPSGLGKLTPALRRFVEFFEIDETLIQCGQAKPYYEATRLLRQVKELAIYQRREAEFEARLAEIVVRYQRRWALMDRFRRALLI